MACITVGSTTFYPDVAKAYSFPNQYILGSDFLVVPIVKPRDRRTNLASVKAWLPTSSHYVDLFTGTVYDGFHEITFYRRLEEYPVLLTEGTIIPMDADPAPRNGCLNPEALEILVVVRRDAQAVILEDTDDNDTQGDDTQLMPRTGQYRKSTISFQQAEGRLVAEAINRPVTFRFLSVTSIPENLKVYMDGIDVTSYHKVTIASYPQTPSLVIDCPSVSEASHSFTIELGPTPQLSVIDPLPRLEHHIMDYQAEFEVKDRIRDVVTEKEASLNCTVGTLMALDYDEHLVGPVTELLMADRQRYS
ncbi:hypothetical protein BDV12DRAFT_171877 [Aspergillus spectabilis]